MILFELVFVCVILVVKVVAVAATVGGFSGTGAVELFHTKKKSRRYVSHH